MLSRSVGGSTTGCLKHLKKCHPELLGPEDEDDEEVKAEPKEEEEEEEWADDHEVEEAEVEAVPVKRRTRKKTR